MAITPEGNKTELVENISSVMARIDRMAAMYPHDYRSRCGYTSAAFELELLCRRLVKVVK